MANITVRLLKSSRAKASPYFIRDSKVKGFAAKVNTSGSIKFVAEVWHEGRTVRKTLGEYPLLSLPEARAQEVVFLQQAKQGVLNRPERVLNLRELLLVYLKTKQLKPSTEKNYQEVIGFYLKSWIEYPVSSITKDMVERKYNEISGQGIDGGKPTQSQAAKTMRILSALMNFAKADELLESNPVEVLKLKRISCSTGKRRHYLKAREVTELLRIVKEERHPMVLAVQLMVFIQA